MIIKFGYIGRTELQVKCGHMSISKYNKLKSYLEEDAEGIVAYDKSRKIWYDLNPQDTEIKRQMVELELIS